MLSLSKAQRYFIYHGITDMRKGVDSLCGLVRSEFSADPLSGDVFIFFSRRKNVVKLICWDHDGFCMYYKRLEALRNYPLKWNRKQPVLKLLFKIQ